MSKDKTKNSPPPGADDDLVVVLPIQDSIDLHTFSPRETPLVLEEYFFACREKGILEVRVIHGKGRGQLRAGVHAFLEKCPQVEGFAPAPPERGGWGPRLSGSFLEG